MRALGCTSAALALCLASGPALAAETLFDRNGVTLERLRTATGYACDLTLRAGEGADGLSPKFILGTDAASDGGLSTRAVWFLDVPEAVSDLQATGPSGAVSVRTGYRDLSFAKDRPAVLDALLSRAALMLQGKTAGGATVSAPLDGAAFSDAFGLLRRDCNLDISRLPSGLLQSAGGEVWGVTADGAYKSLSAVAGVPAENDPEPDAPEAGGLAIADYMRCQAWPTVGAEGSISALDRVLLIAAGSGIDGFVYNGGTVKGRFVFLADEGKAVTAADGTAVRPILPVRSMIPKTVRFLAPNGESIQFISEDGAARAVTSGFVRTKSIAAWDAVQEMPLDLSCLNTAEGLKDGEKLADADDGAPKAADSDKVAAVDVDDAADVEDVVAKDADTPEDGAPRERDGDRVSLWGTPAEDTPKALDRDPALTLDPALSPDAVTDAGGTREVCEITVGPDGMSVAQRGAIGVSDTLEAVLAGRRSSAASVGLVWPADAPPERPALGFDVASSVDVIMPYRPLPAIGKARPVVIAGLEKALQRGDLPVLRIAVFGDQDSLKRIDWAALDAAFTAAGAGNVFAVEATMLVLQGDGAAPAKYMEAGRDPSFEVLEVGLGDSDLGPIPVNQGDALPAMLASIRASLETARSGDPEAAYDHVIWVKGDWTVGSTAPVILESSLAGMTDAGGYTESAAPWLTVIAGHPGNATNGYLAIPLSMASGVGRLIEEADPTAEPRVYLAEPGRLAAQIQADFAKSKDLAPTESPKRLMADGADLFDTTGILVSFETLEVLSLNALDWGVKLARAKSGSDAMSSFAGKPSAHRFGLIDVLTDGGATVLAAKEVTPDWMKAPIADMSKRDLKGLRADLSRFSTVITNAELAAGDQGCAFVYLPLNAAYSGLGTDVE